MMKNKTNSKNMKTSPFAVPNNPRLFEYIQWNKVQKMSRTDKTQILPTCEKKLTEPNKDGLAPIPMGITDIDVSYFTDVAGRTLKERFSRRKYVEQICNVLKTKLLVGYDLDYCIRIHTKFVEEQNRFETIENNYRHYASNFEAYLKKDHDESMKIIAEAQAAAENSNLLVKERDQLLKQVGQARLDVYHWEEIWRNVKMCHEFICKISSYVDTPEKYEKSGNFIKSNISSGQVSSKSSLECLVEKFQRDISDDCLTSTEDITLKDPRELSHIFDAMEVRNLDALIHLESLTGPITEMASHIATAEDFIKEEIGIIEESLEEIKLLISSCQQTANCLKVYVDYLLHQVFRELVRSEAVLQLYVFIEDTYESCIESNVSNMNAYSMMRAVEKTYEELNTTLDNLPLGIVMLCEKEGFTQEIKKIKDADDAARKYDLMHRLLAALERIIVPSEMSLKTKSEYKSTMHKSLIKSSGSVSSSNVTRAKNLHLKQLTIPKRYCKVFSEDCKSRKNTNDFTFEMNKSHEDNTPKETTTTVENRDCRDEIS